MLFNSYVFVFAFLPLALISFWAFNRYSRSAAVACLILFSLFYYGYWNYRYLPLLLGSILINYWTGRRIQKFMSDGGHAAARVLLACGIIANVALLGYFKYTYFALDTIARLFAVEANLQTIVLPLAISFYTFQQIAFLVDSYRGNVAKDGLLSYMAFVSFFPHLIAGPILHHRDIMPQFTGESRRQFRLDDLALGLTIFFIGLGKKVLIADPMAAFSTPTFAAAASGAGVDFYTAWCAALSYTFQIYFDFSGYSDMAVGAARMFGIRVPANFFSPYRASSIIDFWRRWHMTLSRLLRDYLYIPLGGNRNGPARRYVNLMATMLIGGLWHGAGWTFVIWGGLHGVYLAINHGWRALIGRFGWPGSPPSRWTTIASRLLTFLAVVIAWVVFRAEDLPSALRMLAAMSGAEGLSVPARVLSAETASAWGLAVSQLPLRPFLLGMALLAFVWLAPNSYELTSDHEPAVLPRGFRVEPAPISSIAWRPSPAWSFAIALVAAASMLAMLSDRMEFLYYQF